MSYVTTKRMLYSDCPEVVLGESICVCFGCHAHSSSLLFLPLPVCKVYSVASQSPPSTLSPERTGMSRIFSSALSEQCTHIVGVWMSLLETLGAQLLSTQVALEDRVVAIVAI